MAGPVSLHDALGDRYAIERELGHGATATVYLARDLKLNRLVALKVLSPDLALAVRTERFLTEIDTTAQLGHPHVVPLFDGGSLKGFYYYVMPYIRGESLRERIGREGRLPVADALRLARQVAGALDHAHRHGVIHRDIKPGNILLEGEHAWVADFGIALGIASDDSASVTATGVTIGTPAYMSPEQASGDSTVDARSDIYSLGCVLYEMLAGVPPFRGPTVQAVLTQHLVEPVPPLREARPDVPEQVEQIVEIALAKDREHRFATAAEFAQALSLEGAGSLTPTRTQPVRARRPSRVPRWAVSSAGGALAVAAVFVLWKLAFGGVRTLDPSTYLVVPFGRAPGVSASLDAGRLVQDELNKWTGIKVLGAFETPAGQGSPSPDAARRLARDNGAGHFVRGDVSEVGDSLRVRAALYSTTDGSLVRERVVGIAPSLVGAESLFARLAEQVLFDDTVAAANGGTAGTRSFTARQAFARGLTAVRDWRLTRADSAFRQAAEEGGGYSQAQLWIAQVGFWSGAALATWRSNAELAAAGRAGLSQRDGALSDALLAVSRGEAERAWRLFDHLARRELYDFAAWYGLASSLNYDDAVVSDPGSPSGWRFRSSYYRATRAYQRAFQLMPSIHYALSGSSYTAVRRLLVTSGALRVGRAVPPSVREFAAYPDWQGDTLALVPYPFAELKHVPAGIGVAVHRQRELFHEIALGWATSFPRSADALHALAIALQLLGNPAALDTLRRARGFASTPEQQVRIGGEEVWMRVKFSIPSDMPSLRAARALADSLLQATLSSSPVSEPGLLSSLAALTGRATLAAALNRHSIVTAEWEVPGPLVRTALPLAVFAGLGGPVDSIRDLELEVDSAIAKSLVKPSQQGARALWVGRPAGVAYPSYRFTSLPSLAGTGNSLLDAEYAFSRGDEVAVHRILAGVRNARRFAAPQDLTFDVLFPEAWLLAQMGDPRAAIEWLDPTLGSLPAAAPQAFVDPVHAGALVQAICLRAELASRTGDTRGATRWSTVVTILWSDADAFLQPRVHQMERLTGETSGTR